MWLRRSARGRGVAAADDWPRAAPRVDVVNKKLASNEWLRMHRRQGRKTTATRVKSHVQLLLLPVKPAFASVLALNELPRSTYRDRVNIPRQGA